MTTLRTTAALAALLAVAGVARADFTGQTILGPLSNGSLVSGDTTGHSDDNDGFSSGTHIFDIWDGGDDVWQIDWLGGNLTVNLTSLNGSDNDLFLYTPDSYDDSGNYSIVGAFDTVTEFGAAPGTYFVVVDSTFFTEGAYNLEVIPAPATGAVFGLGLLGLTRRRR
ncbi:MAG: PEP-CTERM sorting domain-containing protein [Phycisphaerales bacterium]|nr:PEP-CTERM sorting domain-containing protein [Phycisphaerales bacterium]